MPTDADPVGSYLDSLPEERRETVRQALELVRATLPPGYHETIQYGMISWVVPLERYAYTYNGEPLAVVSLGAQKHHVALHLHGVYMDDEAAGALRRGYATAGVRLDMGRSCLRFQRWDQVVPDAVGRAVSAVPAEHFIALYEAGQGPERMAKHRAAARTRAAAAEPTD